MLVKVSQMEFILNDGTNVDDSVDIHTVLPCANSIDQPLRDIGDLVCNLSIFFLYPYFFQVPYVFLINYRFHFVFSD